jgi:electron transfer flavoprotein alpha subunit
MNGILVIVERTDGAWHRISWEALSAAQHLGDDLNQPVSAALAGEDIDAAAAELAQKRLAKVHAVRHRALKEYTADAFTAAYEQLIRQENPSFILFPHTYQVRDFAPKLATRFSRALISDVTGYHLQEGSPVFVRQLFQGKLNADYRALGSGPCFVSIQAGAFRADNAQAGTAPVEIFTPNLEKVAVRVIPEQPFREAARAVDLTAAEIIVSVGRGIKDKENIPIVEQLAQALGAELAASRPICDNGWLPMERQVGSSGQTVSPKVYFAIGISGAIQHMVGMKGAKTIVAINKDANAPIFEIADYGIVGDLFEIVPALTEEVKKAKSS